MTVTLLRQSAFLFWVLSPLLDLGPKVAMATTRKPEPRCKTTPRTYKTGNVDSVHLAFSKRVILAAGYLVLLLRFALHVLQAKSFHRQFVNLSVLQLQTVYLIGHRHLLLSWTHSHEHRHLPGLPALRCSRGHIARSRLLVTFGPDASIDAVVHGILDRKDGLDRPSSC